MSGCEGVVTSPSILLPYQKTWIEDSSSVKICEKSRRVGLTWAEAADDALQCGRKSGQDVWYIAYEQEIAREFIEDCAGWARRFDKAAKAIQEFVFQDDGRQILAYRIEFPSAHKIVALSSRPRNLRGRQGIAVLDEFAFVDDPEELLKAAMAFLIWGGKVRIISTHNGVDNKFAELINDVRAGRVPYSLHRVSFDEALAQGLYRKICAETGREWSAEGERGWRDEIVARYRDNADEELYCVPRAGESGGISAALIEARMADIPVARWVRTSEFAEASRSAREAETRRWCEDEILPLCSQLKPALMSCFGEDFGRVGDLTVIWPLQIEQDLVRRTPFLVELRNVPFEQQAQILFYVVDRLPHLLGGALDATGNGAYLAEVAAQRYGPGRIAQVHLSTDWYRDNMPRFKAAFEDGTIVVPRDSDVLADLRALRTERGVLRLPERHVLGADRRQRHGDAAIAAALAYHASLMPVREYDYTPAPPGRRLGDESRWWQTAQDEAMDDDRSGPRRGRFGAGAW